MAIKRNNGETFDPSDLDDLIDEQDLDQDSDQDSGQGTDAGRDTSGKALASRASSLVQAATHEGLVGSAQNPQRRPSRPNLSMPSPTKSGSMAGLMSAQRQVADNPFARRPRSSRQSSEPVESVSLSQQLREAQAPRNYQRQNSIEATSMLERFNQRMAQNERKIKEAERDRNREMSKSRLTMAAAGSMPASAPTQSASGSRQAVLGGIRIDLARLKQPGQLPYSDEQLAVISDSNRIVKVNAFAGTGKTATAVGHALARPNARILYVAFAKPMQLEAEKRFPKNVECRTTHSLAYAAIGHKHKLDRSWRAMTIAEHLGNANYREAAMAKTMLAAFFQSPDPEINKDIHCDRVLAEFEDASDAELLQAQVNAQRLWNMMQTPGKIAIPDDAYLKMWGLTQPQLNYDLIIFDEAQDANPVTSDIIARQRHASLLYIGDRHQSIFAFRGAVNSMEAFEGRDDVSHHHLSNTWRFGEKTAGIANTLLTHLKGETVPIIGRGQDATMPGGAPITLLARTNAQLFKEAIACNGVGIHWVGGVQKYQFDKFLDAYCIYARRRKDVKDPFLRRFANLSQMEEAANDSRDRELSTLCRTIQEYRHETPMMVEMITGNAVERQEDASMCLATAHSSKGLDFDYVRLTDDFEFLKDEEEKIAKDPEHVIDVQESNLLYVAATRARKEIMLNTETQEWMDDLPMHLENRQRAVDIAEARERRRHGHP